MSYRRKHIKPKIKRLKVKKKFFRRPVFWIFLVFLIVIGILYFIFFFPKFQISKIEISGNKNVDSNAIKGFLSLNVGHIFLVNTEVLEQKVLYEFPFIESVVVQRKFPDTIVLKIEERKPFAVFCQNNKCFNMDANGVIFDELRNISQNMVVVKKELDEKEVFLGQNIIEKNIVDIIYNVEKSLKDNFQIGIKEALISDTLIFKTSENWQIYFDPNSDTDLAITKMNILLRDEIPIKDRKNIQYIYLQYKDRAYYK